MAITIHNSGQTFGTFVAATDFVGPPIRITAAPERYLLLVIAYRSNTAVLTNARWQPAATAVGEQAMTFLGRTVNATSTLTIEYWGLLAPAAYTVATSRVVYRHPQAVAHSAWALCLTGVNQTTPYVGFPAAATALATNTSQGTTTPTTTFTTAMANVATLANEMIVQGSAWAIGNSANTMIPAASHEWIGARLNSGAALQTAVQVITPAGASTNSNASLGNNVALISIPFVIQALPIKPSTTTAPRAITPPHTAQRETGSVASPIAVVDTTGFNATNTPSFVYGAFAQQSTTNDNPERYSALTATSLTFTGGALTSTNGGTRIQELGGFGDFTTAVAVLTVVLPSNIQVDDIVLAFIYTQALGVPTSSGFTQGISQPTGGGSRGPAYRQDIYWRRVIAGDLVNEAARTFTITPSATAVIHCVLQVYRGVRATGGFPNDTSSITGAQRATAGTIVNSLPVTTTGPNRLVITAFANNVLGNTTREGFAGQWTRRGGYFALYWGDQYQVAAGVSVAASFLVNGVRDDDWTAITIALIPAVTATGFARTITNVIATTVTESRARSRYKRSKPLVLTTSTSPSRARSAYKRSVAAVLSTAVAISKSKRVRATIALLLLSSATVSRAGSRWKRSIAQSGTISVAVSRGRSAYRRSVAFAGTITVAISQRKALKRSLAIVTSTAATLSRGRSKLFRTIAASSFTTAALHVVKTGAGVVFTFRTIVISATTSVSLSRARSRFKRTVAFAGTIAVAVSRSRSRYIRTVARAGTPLVALSRSRASRRTIDMIRTGAVALNRKVNFKRTVAFAGTILTAVRRSVNFKRTIAQTRTMSVTLSRAGSKPKRTVLQVGATTVVVRQVLSGGGTAFFIFASPALSSATATWSPESWLYDGTKYTTPTFFFEATLQSGSPVVPVLARLFDMTTLVEVPGSRISTSANHALQQRVRSAGFAGLVTGRLYRAEMGKTTSPCTMYSAKLIIEVP